MKLRRTNDTSILENLCKVVLRLDASIRFVGIANATGLLLGTAYRSGLTPLLNPEETAKYAVQAALRAATRDEFEVRLGHTVYVLAKYANLIRATITIGSQEKKHLVLVSFDVGSDAARILDTRVLPYLEKKKADFK